MSGGVTIVKVGPRDGYQGIGPFIPTETKIAFLKRLIAASIRRIEIGSFVSPKALPRRHQERRERRPGLDVRTHGGLHRDRH
jgi:isopropylmalate/homocitrate/citramalate synthase